MSTDPPTFTLIVQKIRAGETGIAQHCDAMIAFIDQQDDPAVLKECQRQANAVVAYLNTKEKALIPDYNAAQLIKTKCMHRLGEVLNETVRARGRNSSDNGRLPEEITPMESSRLQRLARVPVEHIEAEIDAATARNEPAHYTRIVNEWHRQHEKTDPEPFSVFLELEAIQEWLAARREKWPQEVRCKFTATVTSLLMTLENPQQEQEEEEPEEEPTRKVLGKGVTHANEAINCLMRIPKNDALRERGFQIVMDWIERAERKMAAV